MGYRLWVIGLLCAAMSASAQKVMRFVPMAGEESEVALNTLQKVVFTPDSVVLVAAQDGAQTPMYKYDYRAIVLGESASPTDVEQVTGDGLPVMGEKFIKDGQIYIRIDGEVFNLMGVKIKN